MRRTGKEGLHTRVRETKKGVPEKKVIEEHFEAVSPQVFVLTHNVRHEGSYVVGIYSSEKEAEEAKKSFVAHRKITEGCAGRLEIEPARVDFRYWEK